MSMKTMDKCEDDYDRVTQKNVLKGGEKDDAVGKHRVRRNRDASCHLWKKRGQRRKKRDKKENEGSVAWYAMKDKEERGVRACLTR